LRCNPAYIAFRLLARIQQFSGPNAAKSWERTDVPIKAKAGGDLVTHPRRFEKQLAQGGTGLGEIAVTREET
jgi:hypothetical protein